MEESTKLKMPGKRGSEPYSEPLLIKHEPLRNITGEKTSDD
jgi:hypothetical protein